MAIAATINLGSARMAMQIVLLNNALTKPETSLSTILGKSLSVSTRQFFSFPSIARIISSFLPSIARTCKNTHLCNFLASLRLLHYGVWDSFWRILCSSTSSAEAPSRFWSDNESTMPAFSPVLNVNRNAKVLWERFYNQAGIINVAFDVNCLVDCTDWAIHDLSSLGTLHRPK